MLFFSLHQESVFPLDVVQPDYKSASKAFNMSGFATISHSSPQTANKFSLDTAHNSPLNSLKMTYLPAKESNQIAGPIMSYSTPAKDQLSSQLAGHNGKMNHLPANDLNQLKSHSGKMSYLPSNDLNQLAGHNGNMNQLTGHNGNMSYLPTNESIRNGKLSTNQITHKPNQETGLQAIQEMAENGHTFLLVDGAVEKSRPDLLAHSHHKDFHRSVM